MLHKNHDEFLKILERTSAQTGFPLRLLEKEYYITLVLSGINQLSDDLVFKGGTCLSKIYYSYYRLSEDLDITLKTHDKSTRTTRSNAMNPVKQDLRSFLKQYDMSIEGLNKAGHKESRQYIFHLDYYSVVLNKEESIKLEISLRFNPILPTVINKINHKFLHPFTKEPLFDAGSINCLVLKELVAEKLRAAATRKIIAARDFYDLGYLLREGFDFKDNEVIKLFKRKLEEDTFPNKIELYSMNLGRSEKEIEEMKARVKDELFPVLTIAEQKKFDMQKALDELNTVFGSIKAS